MNRYDESYSEYFNPPDDDYPVGSAVDATSEENIDGTPYVAAFFNDVIGFMQAVFFGVYGKNARVTGTPETARSSDVWNAIQKFVGDAVGAVTALIPPQANAQNQLADKDFVNSSIATNTAYFIDVFDSVEELNAYSGSLTNNDYAYVKTVDSAGNVLYDRYKYDEREKKWKFEYSLNNTGFTAAQFAAINSGATADIIALVKPMAGATADADGGGGIVPAPKAGQERMVLTGGGTWENAAQLAVDPQFVFDIAHPVTDTYEQYPMRPDPHELYNRNGVQSTWKVIEEYDGAFFRATGGLADPFIEKTVRQTVYWRADADPVVYYEDKELTAEAEVPEGAEAVPVGEPDENNVQEGYVEKPGVLSKQADSAPNITGSARLNTRWGNVMQSWPSDGSGALFQGPSLGIATVVSTLDSYAGSMSPLNMDASRSSPAYGRREEVAPANYTYRIWRRTA